jgi:uncharacterized protein
VTAVTTSPLLIARVARELTLTPTQVAQTLSLFADGNTLPFIARYRKEATGGLDEVQLRDVQERSAYLHEMEERRAAIIASVQEQGKLDDALKAKLLAADTKQALEDLYLPFKPKRRTRAMIAVEQGLLPLAELLWAGEADDAALSAAAAAHLDGATGQTHGLVAVDDALKGARDILAERIAEDAELRGWVREITRARGIVRSTAKAGKAGEASKFKDYAEFSEAISTIPSHRMLAIRRGEAEEELSWTIVAPVEEITTELSRLLVVPRRASAQMTLVVQDAYKRLLSLAIEGELRLELKTRADEEAIVIFGRNLEQLLLAAPAGERRVIGLDPGFRTGVKVAVVGPTGKLLHTDTVYLHQEERMSAALLALVARFTPELIAIGNGTASRETENVARAVLRVIPEGTARPQVVVVNEAGASVYSASDVARAEFPELDVSLRGAVSIARRLQDPLAELVKIDPKSIGVGQYQHDVNQPRLKQRLDDIVTSCVNRVGVELNTASPQLLSYVAGIGPSLAQAIVMWRDASGGAPSRASLRDVPRLGAKAFEQAAGFIRVRGGQHPLDASAVHPERYALVERMAGDLGVEVSALVGKEALVATIPLERYVSDDVGLPTLRDIVQELAKPGRDPREAFEPPAFREDIQKPSDLKDGMVLEGVVTNIVAFGAFVDIGVHQDGLVHVSQLADRYVKDPNDVVQVGQKVRVTVQSVDLARGRIALTMKAAGSAAAPAVRAPGERGAPAKGAPAKGAPKASVKSFVPTSGAVAPNGMRFK